MHRIPPLIVVAILLRRLQQLENHVPQPLILAHTVELNRPAVLVSILVNADFAGILGALLAMPITGVIIGDGA